MTATEREVAAFWIGFGCALRGVFGRRADQADYALVIARRIFKGDKDRSDELRALITELPWPADDEIRRLVKDLGGVGE